MSQSQLRVVVLGAARGLFCPAAATIAAGAAADLRTPDAAATDGARVVGRLIYFTEPVIGTGNFTLPCEKGQVIRLVMVVLCKRIG